MAAWRNGLLVDQRDAYNTTMPTVPLWIGSRQMEEGFQGDVAEILVYDSGLSDADRISVQEYLAQKYGLPGAFDPSSIAGLQLWLKGDSGIGDSSFYSFDERGNTRALVSPTGSVSDFYLYDAYGQQLTASGSTANTFRYGGAFGYVFDGLDRMDVRMRGYDPSVGRWLSRDPWGFYGGLNLYLYSYNDPINLIDPIGAQPIKIDLTPRPLGDERNPYPTSGVPAGESGWYQPAWGPPLHRDRRNEPRATPPNLFGWIRAIDLSTVNLNLGPYGYQGSQDLYGEYYHGPVAGITPGRPFWKQFTKLAPGATITGTWLLQRCKPTSEELENFTTGGSVSGSMYLGLGGGFIYSPTARMTAVSLGVGYQAPRVSGGAGWTWKWGADRAPVEPRFNFLESDQAVRRLYNAPLTHW